MDKSGGGVAGKAASVENSPRNSGQKKSTGANDFDDPNRIWEDLPKHLRIKKRMAYVRRHRY